MPIRKRPYRITQTLCQAAAYTLVACVLTACAPSRQIVALDGLSRRPARSNLDACRPDKFPNERVYFDTDKSVLRPDAQRVLAVQADWLYACPQTALRIEGNADERGTRQYNLALGERRAVSVQAFLVQRGIAASRITTISYGKDRPIARDYAKNRNGTMVITAGGQSAENFPGATPRMPPRSAIAPAVR